MATLERRIRHLIPLRRGSCLMETAIVFATSRDRWFTVEDLSDWINSGGRKHSLATLYRSLKELSKPLATLNGYGFIDLEIIKKEGRGRPYIRAKLSEAASQKLFALVAPKKKAVSYPVNLLYQLSGMGHIEIPPLKIEGGFLPPEDIISLREQKIGKTGFRYLLHSLYPFDAIKKEKVSGTRRWGRKPEHQYLLKEEGVKKILSDENQAAYGMDMILRCSNPLQCPNPNCKICANAGIETRWDLSEEERGAYDNWVRMGRKGIFHRG